MPCASLLQKKSDLPSALGITVLVEPGPASAAVRQECFLSVFLLFNGLLLTRFFFLIHFLHEK